MAGPNRSDDHPVDFGFLHKAPEPSAFPEIPSVDSSFPQLPEFEEGDFAALNFNTTDGFSRESVSQDSAESEAASGDFDDVDAVDNSSGDLELYGSVSNSGISEAGTDEETSDDPRINFSASESIGDEWPENEPVTDNCDQEPGPDEDEFESQSVDAEIIATQETDAEDEIADGVEVDRSTPAVQSSEEDARGDSQQSMVPSFDFAAHSVSDEPNPAPWEFPDVSPESVASDFAFAAPPEELDSDDGAKPDFSFGAAPVLDAVAFGAFAAGEASKVQSESPAPTPTKTPPIAPTGAAATKPPATQPPAATSAAVEPTAAKPPAGKPAAGKPAPAPASPGSNPALVVKPVVTGKPAVSQTAQAPAALGGTSKTAAPAAAPKVAPAAAPSVKSAPLGKPVASVPAKPAASAPVKAAPAVSAPIKSAPVKSAPATSAAVPSGEVSAEERTAPEAAPESTEVTGASSGGSKRGANGKQKSSPVLVGYAVAVTFFLVFCYFTGRLSLFGNATLESLPDVRPLAPNEFRKVPDGTPVPDGHVLQLGESRRFGDVVVTPTHVTREALKFQGFMSGAVEESLTTGPVLKLWLKFENVSGSYAFPPFDAGLMSHRTPPLGTDEDVKANSFLLVSQPTADVRVLNFLQTMDSNFVLQQQDSAKVIFPDETLETFVACSEQIADIATTPESRFTWRIQFRKGVNESSGNGVTTLIDVRFAGNEISSGASVAQTL